MIWGNLFLVLHPETIKKTIMGVDISHIIRHGFRKVEDKKAAKAFVVNTIERLKKNLLIQEVDDYFEYNYDDDYNATTFSLPIYDVEFTLHNGFWQIESFYHYCQIVMHHGDHFWLRRLTFDIARALGQDEAWYAEEYYTWNGGGCETPETTFEEWLEDSIKMYGKNLPEFDQNSIMAQGDVHIPDYEPIYHDSFKECKELYDRLQSKLPNYKLLGLVRTGNGFLRCEKDGKLFLINEETLKPMFEEPIEGMLQSLNGPEFIVKKNELSAVFDMNGNKLTDFVKGQFYWKWAPCDPIKNRDGMLRIIYNEEAGIELPPRL